MAKKKGQSVKWDEGKLREALSKIEGVSARAIIKAFKEAKNG